MERRVAVPVRRVHRRARLDELPSQIGPALKSHHRQRNDAGFRLLRVQIRLLGQNPTQHRRIPRGQRAPNRSLRRNRLLNLLGLTESGPGRGRVAGRPPHRRHQRHQTQQTRHQNAQQAILPERRQTPPPPQQRREEPAHHKEQRHPEPMDPGLEEVHQRALARILDHPPRAGGVGQRRMVNNSQQHRRGPERIQVMAAGIQARRWGGWGFWIGNQAHGMQR